MNAHAAIGAFISQFSQTELALTGLLAAMIRTTDLSAFHTLTRGMDTRVKADRFRELCRPYDMIPKKGALDTRLDLLAQNIAKIRNTLAHSGIQIPEGEPARIRVVNIARLLQDEASEGEEILLGEIYLYADWCCDFTSDLIALFPLARARRTLVLTAPHSGSPQDFHKERDDVIRRARKESRRQIQKKTARHLKR